MEVALPKPRATAPSVPSADESPDSALPIEEAACSDVDTVESRCNPELSPPGADVLQQLTRSKTADGTERLDGWLRMPLAPGQRTASVHVAFCPPFETNPTLDLEQIEGPEGRIRSAQLMPHGVRLDLKLRRKPEEPTDVFLRFSAVWSAAQDSP